MAVFISGRDVISPVSSCLEPHLEMLYEGSDNLARLTCAGMASLSRDARDAIELARSESLWMRNLDDAAILAALSAERAIRERGGVSAMAAVLYGSSRGPARTLERLVRLFQQDNNLPSHASPVSTANSIPATISRRLSLKGGHFYISGACSTSLHTIGVAFSLIKSGQIPEAMVGGVEVASTAFTQAMLSRAKVLTKTLPTRRL